MPRKQKYKLSADGVTPIPPKLLPGDKDNFATLRLANKHGHLALVSMIEKESGEPRAVLCAMSSIEGDPDNLRPMPLAIMIWDNPFDRFHDPTVASIETCHNQGKVKYDVVS